MNLKKTLSVLLASLMLVLPLTACGGEKAPVETPPDPMVAAEENLKTVENLQAEVKMDMNMVVNGESVETKTTMDMTYFIEPFRMMMEMNSSYAGESVNMTFYAEMLEDKLAIYYDDAEYWYMSYGEEGDIEQYDYRPDLEEAGYSYTADGTEEVDGVTQYKYTCEVTGDAMKEELSNSGALDSLASMGLSEDDIEGLFDSLSGQSITETVWISEATMLPVRYEVDMTDAMNALMKAIVESIATDAGVTVEDLGLDMGVTKLVLKVKYFNYNSAEDFEIPAEAKALSEQE